MKQTHFKRILLNKCQEEFEKEDIYEARIQLEQEEDAKAELAGKVMTDEEKMRKNFLRKRERKELRARRLGNTLFIGSLFKLEMLSERIMHQCISELIGDVDEPDVESIEALNKLIKSVGECGNKQNPKKSQKKAQKKPKKSHAFLILFSVFPSVLL